MKLNSAQSDATMIGKAGIFYLAVAIFISFNACASMSARESIPEVMISGSVTGADIQLSPPVLKVEPGQKVIWTNRTNYEIQINFESDPANTDRPSLIPPFSAVRGKFDREGTYSYTLVYISSKTFGRVSGTIIVGNPPPAEKPLPKNPKGPSPPQEAPGTLPEVI